jgi:hypothetical protein
MAEVKFLGIIEPKADEPWTFTIMAPIWNHLEEVTPTGHVIGAVYRSAYWGGLYKVIRSHGEDGVLVECVHPGGGAHNRVGEQWSHATHLDPKDRRIS